MAYHHLLFPITHDCNLTCPDCCDRGMRKKTVDIDKALETIKGADTSWVFITGGEPFLVENLPEIATKLKSYGFKVGITTNGTIMRPEVADHVDRIGVSLDGDREYHDSYRGEGVFDKALAFIGAIKNRCEVVVMSVAFKTNQEALRRLKPIIDEIDPAYWQIQRDVNDPTVSIETY